MITPHAVPAQSAKNMHVLIIPSWYPAYGGDVRGSFFREQALALFKHGCRVGVIYPQRRPLRQWKAVFTGRYGIEVEHDCGMPTYRLHGVKWFPRMPDLALRLWVKDGLRLFEEYVKTHGTPDVVHAHSVLNAGLLAEKIKQRYGVPFVITEHSTAYARELISPEGLDVVRRVILSADRLFAVSNEFCELLGAKLGEGREWEFMPNIVNEAFLSARRSASSTSFRFINVAFADDKKKQSNIVTAFAAEFRESLDVHLLIGGDGPALESLKKLAKDLNIEDQVLLPGRLTRTQVLEEMGRSNAFVLSSQYETFGVVLVEALALGLPVIATRCGGPESIVRPKDGILVPVEDVEALAKAMRHVYDHQSEYQVEEIREACRARYSEQSVALRLMGEYQAVCAANRNNQPCS